MKNELVLPKKFIELSKEDMESITSGPLTSETVTTASPKSLYNIIRKTFRPIKLPFFSNFK